MTKGRKVFYDSKCECNSTFRLSLFYSIVALLFNLFQCCPISAAVTDDYFNSSKFKNIIVYIAPENNKYEGDYIEYNKQKQIITGLNFAPYKDSLNDIMINIANNIEDIYFYRFLYDNKYIYFKEYVILYGRDNLPNVIYCNIKRDVFKYNDDIKKITINEQGRLKLILAERKLTKITYKNEYKEKNSAGAEMPVVAFTFQYIISPKLSKLPSPGKTYEGKAKLGKNPEDGKWIILNSILSDDGINEIYKLLPKKTFEDIIKAKTNDVLLDRKKIRQEQLKKAKIYSLEIPSQKQTHLTGIYIGTVTSDDAIEVSSNATSMDMLRFKMKDLTNGKLYPSNLKVGVTTWHEGSTTGREYRGIKNVFIDIDELLLEDNSRYRPNLLSSVQAFDAAIEIANKTDLTATVNIYCIDNSETVTDYKISFWKGLKSFFSCNERFKTLKEIK